MNYEYCDGATHTIKQGETLYSLSRQYKVPLAIILRANPYIDVYNLQVGDTICIPVSKQGQQGNSSTGMACGRPSSRMPDLPDNTGVDMNRNMPPDTGMGMDMDRNTPPDTGMGMDMGRNMPSDTGMGMDMGRNMPPDTGMGMDMGRNMPPDTGMGMDTGRNMPSDMGMGTGGNMQQNTGISRNMTDSMDGNIPGYVTGRGMMPGMDNMGMEGMAGTGSNNQESPWIKYVVQSGDTLQDILDYSGCSKEMFWEKNKPDMMYMLPGTACFILEK